MQTLNRPACVIALAAMSTASAIDLGLLSFSCAASKRVTVPAHRRRLSYMSLIINVTSIVLNRQPCEITMKGGQSREG
jgi:hypothetical protein